MALTFRCLVDDHERCDGNLEYHDGTCSCHCHEDEGGATRDYDDTREAEQVSELTPGYCNSRANPALRTG